MSIQRQNICGFTLAELLIALAILGVIAAFTIPKVLQANQSAKYNAAAKEVISTVAQAYQQYQFTARPAASAQMSLANLTPYMNYVSIETTGTIDHFYSQAASENCTASSPCMNLHNGGKLLMFGCHFGSGASTNVVFLHFDPDGVCGSLGNGNRQISQAGTLLRRLYHLAKPR